MSCEHNDWGHMGRCVYCNELAENVVRDLRTSLATAERGLAQWHVTHRAQLDRLEQSLATAERERDEANDELTMAHGAVVRLGVAVKCEKLSATIERLLRQRDEARGKLAVAVEHIAKIRAHCLPRMHMPSINWISEQCVDVLVRIRGDK